MNKDKFQILRDFANSNDKPDRTIYQFIKEVLDINSAYEKENKKLKERNEEIYKGFKATTDEMCEYATKLDKIEKYIKQHSNNGTEYLDIFEVKELLDMLSEV